MKLSAFALLAVVSAASASKPQLSISVKDGRSDALTGLDPTVSWSSSADAGDLVLDYGIESSVAATSDIASLPKNVWGKASGNIGEFGISARAQFEGTDFTQADVDIDVTDETSSVHVDASVGSEGSSVDKIELSKNFDADGASVTVNPRYDVASGDADVVVTYSKDDVSVEVTASQESQSITLSKQIDDDNKVSPTISNTGDVSVEWERSLGDDNSITATVTPNESIDVEWNDGGWTASIKADLDGLNLSGTDVSVKKNVEF